MTIAPPLRKYQKRGISFLKKNNGGALFLKPGAGKTAITLNYLKTWYKNNPGEKIILIAPLNVVYDAWEEEPKIWFPKLKVRNLHRDGYADGYDLYLINPHKFVNCLSEKWIRNFLGLIVDESTMFKTFNSKRTEAYHRYIDVIKPSMGIILTGTPITKNLLDIYCPYYLIDRKRLGPDFFYYRGKFFEPTPDGSAWLPREGTQDEIVRRLSYKSFILSEADEKEIGYPKVLVNNIYFKLSPKVWRKYKTLESELIVDLETRFLDRSKHKGKIYTGAVLYGYCTQFTGGNFYEPIFKDVPDKKNPGEMVLKKIGNKTNFIHNERLNVLKELFEVLNGSPLFVLYHYESDLSLFKKLKIKHTAIIKGGMKPTEVKAILKKWNTGKLAAIFAQISTVSHGLNLQFGGSHICYFTLPDNYEFYYQSLHRLARPGQKAKQVTIHRIICRYTVDEIKRLQILNRKIFTASDFNKRLRALSKTK